MTSLCEVRAVERTMKLGPLLLFVPDLEPAHDFYGRVLELKLLKSAPCMLAFAVGTAELHVFKCERVAPAHRHARDASTSISFEVASLESEMERLKSRGVVFHHEKPATNSETGLRYAAFLAPGGNVHELVERT